MDKDNKTDQQLAAIALLLAPVYETYKREGQTLMEFTTDFLQEGGGIQLQLPAWLERLVKEKEDREATPGEYHGIVNEDEWDMACDMHQVELKGDGNGKD